MARRGSKNRELKLIENERERVVTFSKRRNGLFKKVNELATLCGVKIAILLFSISRKPISFGCPNVHSVVSKYLNSNHTDQQQDDDFITNPVLNKELNEVMERLANVKKEGQMLDEIQKRSFGGKAYKEYMHSLGYDELMQLRGITEELKSIFDAARRASSDPSRIGGTQD